ncbi:MAG: redoxin domain-containing protein [Phycisphaerae bacterium]|jgi:peroxiredoxin
MQSKWHLAGMSLLVVICGVILLSADSPAAYGEDGAKTAAADKKEPPKVGDEAPTFELKGTDGKTYRLSELRDKIVVLEWCNQDCPYSNFKTGIGPKAKETSARFAERGVVWLAVDSTHYQTAGNDAKYVKDNKIPHPILLDQDGTVGRSYGAKTTPHLFIIQKGRLVYTGAFGTNPREVRDPAKQRCYVDEVLTALLDGKTPPVSTTDSWGCPVKYKK